MNPASEVHTGEEVCSTRESRRRKQHCAHEQEHASCAGGRSSAAACRAIDWPRRTVHRSPNASWASAVTTTNSRRRQAQGEAPDLSGARSTLPLPRRALHAHDRWQHRVRAERRVHLQARRLREDRLQPRAIPWDALTYGGTWKLFFKNWRYGMDEYRRAFSKKLFLKTLRRLIPSLTMDDIEPGRAGVRAMLLGTDGEMVDDFRIERRGPHPRAQCAITRGHGLPGHRRGDRGHVREGGRDWFECAFGYWLLAIGSAHMTASVAH